MKANFLKTLVAVAALSSAPAVASTLDEPVRVNTDGLQRNVAVQVKKHADESMRSLMQYLWFTRKVHRLWIEDVTKATPEMVAAAEPKRSGTVIRTTGLR